MIEKIGDYKLINDAFPGIGAKLKLFWGHPEFNVLMDELLVYKRGVPREGFPAEVLFALSTLDSLHSVAHPKLSRNWTRLDPRPGLTAVSALGHYSRASHFHTHVVQHPTFGIRNLHQVTAGPRRPLCVLAPTQQFAVHPAHPDTHREAINRVANAVRMRLAAS